MTYEEWRQVNMDNYIEEVEGYDEYQESKEMEAQTAEQDEQFEWTREDEANHLLGPDWQEEMK